MDVIDGLTDLMDIALVRKADRLATTAHAGQTDKSGHPYIEHVHRVAMSMRTGWLRAAALLHDVVEDTEVGEADLMAAGMPREVIDAVLALTHRPNEPRADYYARIWAAGPKAVAVKRADIADNANPERLALLDEATQERLRRKYADALDALGGA